MRKLWSSGAYQDQQKVQPPISFLIYALYHLPSFFEPYLLSPLLCLKAWRKTIANRRIDVAQTMSATQWHNEARGRVWRLGIRYGRSCNLVVAGLSRLLLRYPYCFRSHDIHNTRYHANERRGNFSFSHAVFILSFQGRAVHSGISAGTDLAFTRGYEIGFSHQGCQWRVDIIRSRYIFSGSGLFCVYRVWANKSFVHF